MRRHHLHETVIQRAVRQAAIAAGITKPVTPHTLLSTTMIYTHVVRRGPLGVQSPLDRPP
jgi:site-specific recombinase XerD